MPVNSKFNPTAKDFLRRFFQLAAVNILSNLMVPLAGLIDVAFLGHLAEIRHLAGVALATVLFNYIYWTFGFLRMGTTGTTAQAVGRSDSKVVLLTGLRNALVALLLGLTILILQHPLRELGFTLLSATSEVKSSGQTYYNSLIWGAPATLFNYVLIGWFLGREQGGKVLLLSIVSNGTKVVLDYLFIVSWGWESAGAGFATAISQYLMSLAGLILIYYEGWLEQVPLVAGLILDTSALKATFTLNKDILVRTFALISTFALFTNLSSSLGTVILATNTLLLQVVSLAAYFIDGLAFATESLTGIFHGQGEKKTLVNLVRISGGVSFALGMTFALVFILFPNSLFRLLTNHLEIIEHIGDYVLWLLPVLGFGSLAYMLDGYFIGLTAGRILRSSMIFAALVGFAPTAIAAYIFNNTQILWLALSLFMAVRAIALAIHIPKTWNA